MRSPRSTRVIAVRAGWAILLAATAALVGAVTAASSVVGIALVAIIIAGVVAAVDRTQAAMVLVFVGTAFPKAGLRVADTPLPIFLVTSVVAAVLLWRADPHRESRPKSLAVVVSILLAFTVWRATVAFETGGVDSALALVAWLVGPLVIVLLVAPLRETGDRLRRTMYSAFLLTVAYALVQAVVGVDASAVPGVTYALGDDLAAKNNSLGTFQGVDVSKIPSTYQSGNIYGIVAAVFAILALGDLLAGRRATRAYLVAVAAPVAVLLSGSRTAILALVAGALLLLLSRGLIAQRVRLVGGTIAVATAVLALRPDLLVRYSLDDVRSTGGAGRLDQWRAIVHTLDIPGLLVGTSGTPDAEGWAGILTQVGLVGVVLAVVTIRAAVPLHHRPPALGLVLVVAAFFDTTYYLFPTLTIPALLCGAVWRAESTSPTSAEDAHEDHDTGASPRSARPVVGPRLAITRS